MDFITDGELDGYVVLIFFVSEKKKSLPSKNLNDFG